MVASRKARSWLAMTTGISRGSAFSQFSSWPIRARSRWLVGSSSSSTSASVTSTRASMAKRCQPPLNCFSGISRSASRHLELLQRHIDPPAFAELAVGGERLEHGRMQRPVHQGFRHVLLDIADRQPAGSGDVAFAGFHRARDATEQGGLAAAVGGDKPDPVAGIDDEVELREQRRAEADAEIAEGDEGHDRSLVLPRSRYPGHAAFVGCRCQSAAMNECRQAQQAPGRMATKGRPGRSSVGRVLGQPCKRICRA